MIAAQNSIPPGSNVNAGNPAAVPTDIPVDSNTGLATLPLATTTPNTSEVLATLTPLAFISKSSGTAAATRLYDPDANVFLYAVGVSSFGEVSFTGLTDPDMVYFFYDDPSRTNSNLQQGKIVAKFLLPLTVLSSNGVETPVSATLQFKVPATGQPPCSASTVVSSLWPMGIAPAQIGLNCAVVFSGSPTSAQQHAIFEVAIPLLVTQLTDPAYSYSLNTKLPGPINTAIYTAFGFTGDDLGATLPNGASIGLSPQCRAAGASPGRGGVLYLRVVRHPSGRKRQRTGPRSCRRSVLCDRDRWRDAPLGSASCGLDEYLSCAVKVIAEVRCESELGIMRH